jgi:hypothetical protein
MLFYMAKAPAGVDVANWDGAGQVWFKVRTRTEYSQSISQLGRFRFSKWVLQSQVARSPGLQTEWALLLSRCRRVFHLASACIYSTYTRYTYWRISRYLLRSEHIGLHQAQGAGGAQFFLSCAQLNVTDGGTGKPGPLVSFPGAYSASVSAIQW